MTSSPDLVTIGITAFNAQTTVSRAISSALAQTWPSIEIVVVDDTSSDGTFRILTDLAKATPALRVFQNVENMGVAGARNRILAEAQGRFVAFFDDDDESVPERIALQMRRLTEYEANFAGGAPVVCHSARLQIYPDGRTIEVPTMGQREDTIAPHGPAVALRILLGYPPIRDYGACATSSQFARLATYRALGGFDRRFRRSEDTEFNVRLALQGGHFVGLGEACVRQTMTPTGEKTLDEEDRYHSLLLATHAQLAQSQGLLGFAQQWLAIRAEWRAGKRMLPLLRSALLALRHPVVFSARVLSAATHGRTRAVQDELHRLASRTPPSGASS